MRVGELTKLKSAGPFLLTDMQALLIAENPRMILLMLCVNIRCKSDFLLRLLTHSRVNIKHFKALLYLTIKVWKLGCSFFMFRCDVNNYINNLKNNFL